MPCSLLASLAGSVPRLGSACSGSERSRTVQERDSSGEGSAQEPWNAKTAQCECEQNHGNTAGREAEAK